MTEKIKNFDTIVYHSPCPDGTGALWCATHYAPIPNKHNCKAGIDPTGNYTGKNVIFVDICPSLDYLLELVKVAKHVVVLDHHKSSEQMVITNIETLTKIPNLFMQFDMEKSGCQLAWDYFFEDLPRPFFIDYIADRDLWTWKLPNSKEINNSLNVLGYIDSFNLSKLDSLLENPEEKLKLLESEGKIISLINKRELDIAQANGVEAQMEVDGNIYRIWLGGNLSPGLRSDLGNQLSKHPFKDGNYPDFVAVWQFNPKTDEWWISLRGNENKSPDLSVICAKFGGGGHYYASGFTIKSPKGLKEVFIF